jgi:hypothetical protein
MTNLYPTVNLNALWNSKATIERFSSELILHASLCGH